MAEGTRSWMSSVNADSEDVDTEDSNVEDDWEDDAVDSSDTARRRDLFDTLFGAL